MLDTSFRKRCHHDLYFITAAFLDFPSWSFNEHHNEILETSSTFDLQGGGMDGLFSAPVIKVESYSIPVIARPNRAG